MLNIIFISSSNHGFEWHVETVVGWIVITGRVGGILHTGGSFLLAVQGTGLQFPGVMWELHPALVFTW